MLSLALALSALNTICVQRLLIHNRKLHVIPQSNHELTLEIDNSYQDWVNNTSISNLVPFSPANESIYQAFVDIAPLAIAQAMLSKYIQDHAQDVPRVTALRLPLPTYYDILPEACAHFPALKEIIIQSHYKKNPSMILSLNWDNIWVLNRDAVNRSSVLNKGSQYFFNTMYPASNNTRSNEVLPKKDRVIIPSHLLQNKYPNGLYIGRD